MTSAEAKDRQMVIHLLRSGLSAKETATVSGSSLAWVYQCQAHFEASGWPALEDHSRAPTRVGRKCPKGTGARFAVSGANWKTRPGSPATSSI